MVQLKQIIRPKVNKKYIQSRSGHIIIEGALIKEIGLSEYCEGILLVFSDYQLDQYKKIRQYQRSINQYKKDATWMIQNRFDSQFKRDILDWENAVF